MKYILFSLLLLFGGLGFSQPDVSRGNLARSGADILLDEGESLALRFPDPLTLPARTPEAAGQLFLSAFAEDLGLDANELPRRFSNKRAADGRYYLRYQRTLNGLTVLGELLTVSVAEDGAIVGYAGRVSPPTPLAPAAPPVIPRTDLTPKAIAAITHLYPFAGQWNVTEEAAVYTRRNPWQTNADDPPRPARVFVITEPAGTRAERVFLDAVTGRTLFHHQLHCTLTRRLYHRSSAAFNIVWREGDSFPGDLRGEDRETLTATAETYNLFLRTFGRDGYDDEGGPMRSITDASLSNCPNANAFNGMTRHCAGVVSDDIVAHEWMHNYIKETNGLIYAFQSGAINEGLADIFGEAVDLLNDRGLDTDDDRPRTGCDDGNLRWCIAEDAAAIDTILRDMWMPECKTDPSARNGLHYECTPGERSQVHSHSGLINRGFVLLTDGGTLNGDTIIGIGMTKALHIFYHAHANYLTPVTDFHAFGNALLQSGNDLRGTDLPALTLVDLPAMASGERIDSLDLAQLFAVVRATQLREEDNCSASPTLAQEPPTPCASATLPGFGIVLAQNWEDSLGGWTVTESPVNAATWNAKPWVVTGSLPDGRGGLGVFAANPRAGDCLLDIESGTVALTSPVVTLPMEETEFVLTFDHYYALQEELDGGVLYASVNGGDFGLIPHQAFLYNGYDGRLENAFRNDNPLANTFAFHGTDDNSTSGTWGRSIVDLNAAGLAAGNEVQLRWVLSHDGCDGMLGWYLDDIQIGFCGDTALPVRWASFTAAAGKGFVRLDWAVTEQTGNGGFHVERRGENEAGFRALGFVAAVDEYAFHDREVAAGVTYVYRLRQEDLDGTVSYSELVSATLAASDDGLTVYPNPAREVVRVTGAGDSPVSVHDLSGRRWSSTLTTGGRATLSLGGLPAGVYVIRAGTRVQRLVKE